MSIDEFIKMIKNENFPDPVLVEQPANGSLDTHSHPFEVKALIINGSINLEVNGIQSSFSKGDVFHLQFNQPHKESYGSSGVQYLASRKSSPGN